MTYNILDETFCTYCQEEFKTPRRLQNHIFREHKGTYAEQSVADARIALRRTQYDASNEL